MKVKVRKLPDTFRRQRRMFWVTYLGSQVSIFVLTAFIMVSVAGMEELTETMDQISVWDISFLAAVILLYGVFFIGFYLSMRFSQKQCLEKYEQMSAEEKRQVDIWCSRRIGTGDVIYTEHFFMHRDKRRFFFPYIHTYREIVWAYLAQSFYPSTGIGPLSTPVDMKFQTIVFQVADGRKYSILMGDSEQFQKQMPKDVVIGYGSEQKRRARERLWKFEEYDSSLPEKRRAYRWKFFWTVAVLLLIAAAGILMAVYFESAPLIE